MPYCATLDAHVSVGCFIYWDTVKLVVVERTEGPSSTKSVTIGSDVMRD